MGNDRDDKFEGHEESEYHFSDDEANYEIETEAPKQAAAGGQKENILSRLTTKRMLISLAVFIVLVIVVFKMVAPTSSVPSTEITAPVAQQNAMPAKNQVPAVVAQNQAAPQAAPSAPVQPVVPPVPGAMPQQTQTTLPVAQPAMVAPPAQPSAVPQSGAATVAPPVPVVPAAPPSVAVAAQPPAQQAMPVQPSVMQQPIQPPPPPNIQPPAMAQQQVMQPAAVTPPPPPVVAIPAGTQPPMVSANQPATSPIAPPVPTGTVDQQTAALSADVDRLTTQMQATYAQKINDNNNQTKALQDQVQTLNAKVANVESQLNQIVQLLSRQQAVSVPVPVPVQPQIVEVPKVSYNVQAIIPGRAWLKSDNGETLTVAEGDVVRDIGRVTKIDPYDGVVEISTGGKVISLTYGNGG